MAVVAAGFGGLVYVGLSGSAIVYDDTGKVVSVVVTNDRWERPLLRLPGGIFFGIPRFDGTIEVRCRNGSKTQIGYVTPGLHTSARAVGSAPCRAVEEV
jgi:hypothetical protein